MPLRMLRETILSSDRVNQLSAAEEVFYRRLMSVVDDFGRYDARPSILKAALFPLRLAETREADISRWLAACEKAGLVALYQVEGKPYLEYLRLGEPRAKKSKYPSNKDPRASEFICAQVNSDVPPSPSPSSAPSPAPALACGKPQGAGDSPPAPKLRPRNVLFDAVSAAWFGGAPTTGERSLVGKLVRDLGELGATPAEIELRRQRIRARWGKEADTGPSLLKHWRTLDADEADPEDDGGGTLQFVNPTMAELDALFAGGEGDE